MGLHVTVQVEFCEETSIAVFAEELLFALVNHKMLVQVGLLGERMVTALDRAVVWPLTGVDSQVVEEVMPLSKDLLAVGVGACEESDDSPVVGVLILIDHEVLGGRHVLVDANLMQIELRALVDLDEVVITHCLTGGEVLFKIEAELIFNLFNVHFEFLLLYFLGGLDELLRLLVMLVG